MNIKYPEYVGMPTEKRRRIESELKDGDKIKFGDRIVPKIKGIKGGFVRFESENEGIVGITNTPGTLKHFKNIYSKTDFKCLNLDENVQYIVIRPLKPNKYNQYG